MNETPTRRIFLGAAATACALSATGSAAQANDRLICAVIGVRGRGRAFYAPLAARNDTAVAALCDIDANVLAGVAKTVETAQGRAPRTHEDFRRILDDKSIDAVFIATPHHWHSPIALRACRRASTST